MSVRVTARLHVVMCMKQSVKVLSCTQGLKDFCLSSYIRNAIVIKPKNYLFF
jgi:hypothetical protein